MLDIKRIREKEQEVRKGLESRGADTGLIDKIIALDEKRRSLLTEVESLKSQRNKVSKDIGASTASCTTCVSQARASGSPEVSVPALMSM